MSDYRNIETPSIVDNLVDDLLTSIRRIVTGRNSLISLQEGMQPVTHSFIYLLNIKRYRLQGV